jgi:hypothetical protein
LCAKDTNIPEVMRVVMDVVCFIRAHALNHRQFNSLLEELDSEKGDVLLHADVRWLSRAKVMLRFCQLLPEIRVFLTLKCKEFVELSSPEWLVKLAFLTDISQHLNTLNRQLQGENKTLPALFQRVEAFTGKLALFNAHIATGNFTHFSELGKMVADIDSSRVVFREQKFGEMIDTLLADFENRFSECRQIKPVLQFTTDPFAFAPVRLVDIVSTHELAEAQLALLELHSDMQLTGISIVDTVQMWKCISRYAAYNVLTNVAKRVLSMFGSTYRCESAFSAMKGIKSKDRNRLTDCNLVHCVRAVTTRYVPSFKDLVRDKQCQGSH